MPHLKPLPQDGLPELEPEFAAIEASLGFVPNSMLTMAHRPDVLRAHVQLSASVLGAGTVPRGLKHLIALVASTAAGCRYCQAHNGALADRYGIPSEKLAAIWDFERDPQFGEAERAALTLARDAAQLPNLATATHFTALSEHYSDEEVVEIVAVIAFFGWLNRWTDTLAMVLEDEPRLHAEQHLRPQGWEIGKHGSDG